MFNRRDWKYGKSILNRDYLKADETFEQLLEQLYVALSSAESAQTKFAMEPEGSKCGDRLLIGLECKRPSWRIQLDAKLLDKFFNGLMGIRAQYYQNPYHGLRQNQLLILRLREPLIRLAKLAVPDVDCAFLHDSLAKSSAKAWVCEKDIQGHDIIQTTDSTLDENSIQNDWLDRAREVKQGDHNSDYNLYCRSINGVRAPIPDQLEIKGAWLTREGQFEYVTPDKWDRHCQLFMFGFS